MIQKIPRNILIGQAIGRGSQSPQSADKTAGLDKYLESLCMQGLVGIAEGRCGELLCRGT